MGTSKKIAPIDILLVVLPLLTAVAVLTFAAPCGVHDDGSVSTCFWAARAVLGASAVAAFAAVLRLSLRGVDGRAQLDMVIAALGALTALVPGVLVGLCMMQTMRCHTIMRPVVVVLGSILCAVAVVDAVAARRARAGA